MDFLSVREVATSIVLYLRPLCLGGKEITMKILLYFDWAGSRKDLKEWNEKIIVACKETDVSYEGLYGSMNEKWNHVAMFEASSYDEFLEMAAKVPKRPMMTHYITELLLRHSLSSV